MHAHRRSRARHWRHARLADRSHRGRGSAARRRSGGGCLPDAGRAAACHHKRRLNYDPSVRLGAVAESASRGGSMSGSPGSADHSLRGVRICLWELAAGSDFYRGTGGAALGWTPLTCALGCLWGPAEGVFRWGCERRCGLRGNDSWWLTVAGSVPGHRPVWLVCPLDANYWCRPLAKPGDRASPTSGSGIRTVDVLLARGEH
jgi:hypothetical protein